MSSGVSQRSASSIAGARQVRRPTHLLELFRMREEREEGVAQRPIGRLDACGQQQVQEGEDVVVGQPASVHLGLDELADQVVARLAAPLCDALGEVRAERPVGGHAAVPAHEDADELDRPPLEARRVSLGQTEDARDDAHREREREPAHEIARARRPRSRRAARRRPAERAHRASARAASGGTQARSGRGAHDAPVRPSRSWRRRARVPSAPRAPSTSTSSWSRRTSMTSS